MAPSMTCSHRTIVIALTAPPLPTRPFPAPRLFLHAAASSCMPYVDICDHAKHTLSLPLPPEGMQEKGRVNMQWPAFASLSLYD